MVEEEERYLLKCTKGERNLWGGWRKRGGVGSKRGLCREQIGVLVVCDGNTRKTDVVLGKADTEVVGAVLGCMLDVDTVLCSDSVGMYGCFAEQAHMADACVNLSVGMGVVDDVLHIQNVNAYHSGLKGWMARFHGVATKYLPNYLGWRR